MLVTLLAYSGLFGGYNRPVPSQNADTLLPIIKQWAAYDTLAVEGYTANQFRGSALAQSVWQNNHRYTGSITHIPR